MNNRGISENKPEKTYEQGLKEAWQAAIKIFNAEAGLINMFGSDDINEIMQNYIPSDAIEIIRDFETVKIGDEVVLDDSEKRGIIIGEYENFYLVMPLKSNWGWQKDRCKKTGKHYPMIKDRLRIGGEEDN